MLSEDEYVERAQRELALLVARLDLVEATALEVELANDILTLEFDDGSKYVVNSHRAARQIWMAAERNAWHFDWEPRAGAWVAQKTGEELWATLNRVTERKLGATVGLVRPA